ncbi:MAG TPA: cytochrome c biogenesis protein CcsA [Gemmataceae bacterium]|nr:cytochrome c biogenesis protein CcsA [Gemmataceae bacterium]
MNWSRIIPGSVVGTAALFLLLQAPPQETAPDQMALDEFATLPVVDGGRIKPIDTVARTSLMIISKRQTVKDEKDNTQPAIRWLLDVLVSRMGGGGAALEQKVFRIENDEVLAFLDLKTRPGSFRYSLKEIRPKWDDLEGEIARIQDIDESQHTKFDQALLELRSHIEVFLKLGYGKSPYIIPVDKEGEEWKSYSDTIQDSFRLAELRLSADKSARGLSEKEYNARVRLEALHILGAHFPAAAAWTRILHAYQTNDAKEFNKAVADFRKAQGQLPEGTESKARLEVFFNHFAPFYQCTILYIFVFLLACGAWLAYPQVLNRAAFWLCGLTLALHTLALVARMYLQGRPPVTNLYSSAIFIGWGGVVLGMIVEWIYRNGIGNVLAAVLGGTTALIAHHLAGSGRDTMEMMQAVLDTNFWLATHVTCVTLGYAATFFAGFLGLLFVLLGLFTRRLDREMFLGLGQMIYGVVCFATLLSFVGTVLGGIWADYSWGRFWGWDPKENGALLIVLMNALILHARWGGMVKQRGMAVLAMVGNMVTGWSWFGTNQLSVGLHAYGFNKTLAEGLAIFWSTQLICIGLGLVPTRYWRSFGQVKLEPAQPTPKRRDRR